MQLLQHLNQIEYFLTCGFVKPAKRLAEGQQEQQRMRNRLVSPRVGLGVTINVYLFILYDT